MADSFRRNRTESLVVARGCAAGRWGATRIQGGFLVGSGLLLTTLVLPLALAAMADGKPTARDQPTRDQPMLASTKVADCLPEFDPSKACPFMAFGMQFEVEALGKCRRVSGTGAPVEVLLPLEPDFRIDRVLYGRFRGDLLLVYEISDGESGAGAIVRLSPRSFKIEWSLALPAFNLSLGAIEGARLYQAGIGFVAAIDLNQGVFVWKHRGLYDERRLSFNAFERPDLTATDVIFREERHPQITGHPRTIRVVKNTGKMRVQ